MSSARRLLFVGSLMHQYCEANELANFWKAWAYHPAGRSFPSLLRHMYELTVNFTFRQCHLARDWQNDPGTICVGPRCQCAGQTTKERVSKVMLPNQSQGGQRRRRRVLLVPEWVVKNSLNVKVEPIEDLLDCPPRYRILPMETRAPLRLQGVSRFAQTAGVSRCVVDTRLCLHTQVLIFGSGCGCSSN